MWCSLFDVGLDLLEGGPVTFGGVGVGWAGLGGLSWWVGI